MTKRLQFYYSNPEIDEYHFFITGGTHPGIYFLQTRVLWYQHQDENLQPIFTPNTNYTHDDQLWGFIEALTGLTKDGFRLAASYFQEGYQLGYNDRGSAGLRRPPV